MILTQLGVLHIVYLWRVLRVVAHLIGKPSVILGGNQTARLDDFIPGETAQLGINAVHPEIVVGNAVQFQRHLDVQLLSHAPATVTVTV